MTRPTLMSSRDISTGLLALSVLDVGLVAAAAAAVASVVVSAKKAIHAQIIQEAIRTVTNLSMEKCL